jgi:glycopeptide antibiotics resistance protein
MLVELKEQVLVILQYSWPMIVMTLVVAITIRVGYLKKHNEKAVLYKEIFNLLFILYILCLFHAVTYQDVSWSSANVIPFKEILRYDFGSGLFYKNIFGNLLLFLPYGLYVTYYLNLKKSISVVMYAFVVSLSIELIQSIIGRVFDVDDILLNIFGALLGYFIYKVFDKFEDILPDWLKKEWLIDVLVILLVGGVVWFLIR